MKSSKTDHRSRYTQMIVKKSLMTLLRDNQLNKISVTELCRAASINRGTFYNHFFDVYDVFESIEEEFYNEVLAKLESEKSYAFETAFFRGITLLLSENLELTKIIITDSSSSFLKRIIPEVRKKFVSELSERYTHTPAAKVDDAFIYTMNGSIGILTDWINNPGKHTSQDVAHMIESFNRVIIDSFIKKQS